MYHVLRESMSVIHKDYETINGTTTVDFLRLLEVSYPDAPKIHVILDQSGYHRSNEVAEFVKNSRIVLHFLPPYSPNLNPIERLWKVMNEHARNNVVFESTKKFKAAIFGFFTDTLPKIGDELRSRINDNFQVIKSGTSI